MHHEDVGDEYPEVVERFAVEFFERQLERFVERFGRLPRDCDSIFLTGDPEAPEPMCPQEIVALVVAEALADTTLEFDSPDVVRAFAILVLLQMGLSPEDAEDALMRVGRFSVN